MKSPRFFVLLVGALVCTACTTTRDYYSSFEIVGKVSTVTAEPVTLKLIDTGLDYVRAESQYVFFESQISSSKRFSVQSNYFWGTKGVSRFSQASFEARIEAPKCQPFTRKIGIAALQVRGNVRVLDLGDIALKCAET